MTLHHAEAGVRRFKSTGKGGGSALGKASFRWPLFLTVAADAILLRVKGGSDAWTVDRKSNMTPEEFADQIDRLFPDVWEWVVQKTPHHKRHKRFKSFRSYDAHVLSRALLLMNRVYKMYYSGTSDRGRKHDPRTRACESKEHWRKKVPVGDGLFKMHDRVYRGLLQCVPGWRQGILFRREK